MTSWFQLDRVPEPEVMDESGEVEAYASAAANAYLESIDRTFVEHVARLLPPIERLRGKDLRAVDIGCGPGQIPILMARRWPEISFSGLDAAPHMIAQANENAQRAGVTVAFQVLQVSKGSRLPFPDASFDLVTCNSVLHHLAEPVAALNEMARVGKPGAAILLRDLRRPSALTAGAHIRWFGRHYSGEMRRLYEASVRAAYTVAELQKLLDRSKLAGTGARVFRHELTHLGIERPFSA